MKTALPLLEVELLRALRSIPEQTLDESADAISLPRTNFGRPLTSRLRTPMRHLVGRGLIEEHDRRFRLSERGRRALADRAFGSSLGRMPNDP